MTVITDTREPWPHPWAPYLPEGTRLVRATLETGDVCLAALPDGAVCERKTISDFLAAVGRERLRFDKELRRARHLGAFVIIVEGSFGDVLAAAHARGGGLSSASILGSVAAWTRRGAPVLFAGTVRTAAELAFAFLAGQVREIERDAKALARAERPEKPASGLPRRFPAPAGTTPPRPVPGPPRPV